MKVISFETRKLLRDTEERVLPEYREQFLVIKNKILTNGYEGNYDYYRARDTKTVLQDHRL